MKNKIKVGDILISKEKTELFKTTTKRGGKVIYRSVGYDYLIIEIEKMYGEDCLWIKFKDDSLRSFDLGFKKFYLTDEILEKYKLKIN
jgi:hypothetical protein